jgi:hypothetical protein
MLDVGEAPTSSTSTSSATAMTVNFLFISLKSEIELSEQMRGDGAGLGTERNVHLLNNVDSSESCGVARLCVAFELGVAESSIGHAMYMPPSNRDHPTIAIMLLSMILAGQGNNR